ncbi:MAG: hypothetical protein JSR77_15555 [Planctomycetes bacterium]|nr:hypothetical protein [Planctomycetota bacterium]
MRRAMYARIANGLSVGGRRSRGGLLAIALGLSAGTTIAAEPGFHLVGFAPGGNESVVMDLSRDGEIAAGWGVVPVPTPTSFGFTWTAAGGMTLVTGGGFRSNVFLNGISADGTAFSGIHWNTNFDKSVFLRQSNGVVVNIPNLPGYPVLGDSQWVSGDGLTVVGSCRTSNSRFAQAFRWTSSGGLQALGFARGGDNISHAYSASHDGRVIVGESANFGGGTSAGFVWTPGEGIRMLPDSNGGEAWGVTADGTIIVGTIPTRGAWWDAQRQLHTLPLVNPTDRSMIARSVSDDGMVITGSFQTSTNELNGFVWTPSTGSVLAADFFASRSAVVPQGYRVYECVPVSGDGKTIGGRVIGPNGWPQGFVAHLGPPCSADFNKDGGVDGADVESFFVMWQSAEADADVNEDGGIDGSDVETFFGAWEAGGCA